MATHMNEIMTGISSRFAVYSNITLAFMEDSGWYRVDWAKAPSEPLVWGRKLGCQFLTEKCETGWPSGNGYFCKDPSTQSCTFDRRALGICAISKYSTQLEPVYQHFSDPSTGGSVELPDFCPYTIGFSDGYCTAAKGSSGEQFKSDYGETFSKASRCFTSTLANALGTASGILGGGTSQANSGFHCYPMYCAGPTALKIRVGADNNWYACTKGGDTVSVTGYKGDLTCPTAVEISHLCEAAPVLGGNDTFPVFISIDPTQAATGAKVTITGQYLGTVSAVYLGDKRCDNLTVISDTSLTCRVGSQLVWNPFGSNVDIVLATPKWRLATTDAFKVNFNLGTWAQQNPFLTLAICVAALVVFLILCFIIYRYCSSPEKAEKKQHHHHHHHRLDGTADCVRAVFKK
jgi:hypothetical protein